MKKQVISNPKLYHNFTLYALIIALTLFVLAGCQKQAEAPAADGQRNEVIIAINTESEPAAGFDPCNNWGATDHVHEPLIQSTLIYTDQHLNFQNDLATAYESSEDGLTWTFTIRNDVKFSDGEPLTAQDVAFTFNTAKDTASSQADLTMLDQAEAIDETTVVFHLNQPFNAFLYTVATLGIVPEHAYGPDYGQQPIGSGRYLLEQWDKGQQVILKANPDYYGEAPLMERVVILFMGEDAALAAAKAGEVDAAYTSATYSTQTIAGMHLFACNSVDSRGISLPVVKSGGTTDEGDPVGDDVTADPAIRQAINLAVDRKMMADNVLNGYGTAAYSVSDNMPWYNNEMAVVTDTEQATKLLEEAGWQMGDDGIRQKDGQRASFTLLYPAYDSVRQALAADFTNQMAEIGLEITYTGLSWDEIYQRQYSAAVLWGWGANSPIEIYHIYHSAGNANAASYSNETVDSYIEAALAAVTVEDAYDDWQKAQWDGVSGFAPQGDAPWVWLVNVQHLYFVKDDLLIAPQKLHPHGHGWSLVNNVDQWQWQTGE